MSREKERERKMETARERGTEERAREVGREGGAGLGRVKRDGRRVQVAKEGWPVSVGKRVASTSSLFHPPATLLPACCSVQRGDRRVAGR